MLHGHLQSLRWVALDAAVAPSTAANKLILNLFAETGIPQPPLSLDVHQEAIYFLRCGAEIEHALLVQYLYGAYSVAINGDAALGDLQESVLEIAREEMGHLLTVQNLIFVFKETVSRTSIASNSPQILSRFY